MIFLTLLIFPIIISVLVFIFLKTVTWKEFLLQFGVQLIVAGACAVAVSCSSTSDTEIISGTVTGKQKTKVSCSHSYDCYCRNVKTCTGSGKNRSCSSTRVCQTCYDHSNDWDWDVKTTIGKYEISRIDRQGNNEPPRWAQVYVGEPVASRHTYDNYIKAAPDTLFKHTGLTENYKDQLPDYPNNIYDYYKLNRLVTVGVQINDIQKWNESLMVLNGDLGPKKQVNAIIVIVKSKPQDWYYALEQHWIGGKKNDAILVISVNNQLEPQWAQVMAWTTNKVFEVKLRDSIMQLPKVERLPVIRAMHSSISNFYKRKPMADFEYLKASAQPSTTAWIVTMLIGLICSLGLAFFMHKNDVFGDE